MSTELRPGGEVVSMVSLMRHSRSIVLSVIGVVVLATCAATASAEDSDLVDVSKQTVELQKKIDQLRSQGRWAREGKLATSAVCGDPPSAKLFAPWGDPAEYVPAPEGDLEDASGWDLNDHAQTGNENSPFSEGSHSLFLGEGGEATTPAMCVSTLHPTIRFFAQNGGAETSRLEIEIIYEDLDGHTKHLKIARLRGTDSWAPSIVVPIYMNMLAAASEDGVTAVALRFRAHDVKSKTAGWRIDDLAVDPWKDT
jgi:hypothetical protein